MRAAPSPILRPVRAYTWRIPGEYLANTWESAQPPTAHQIRQDGARRVWSAFGRRRVRSSCRNWRICSMLGARRARSASDMHRIGSSPRRQRIGRMSTPPFCLARPLGAASGDPSAFTIIGTPKVSARSPGPYVYIHGCPVLLVHGVVGRCYALIRLRVGGDPGGYL